jgi:hypothetical protein
MADAKCPYCMWELRPSQAAVACSDCGVTYHEDCWQENGGCGTFGCRSWANRDVADGVGTAGAAPRALPPLTGVGPGTGGLDHLPPPPRQSGGGLLDSLRQQLDARTQPRVPPPPAATPAPPSPAPLPPPPTPVQASAPPPTTAAPTPGIDSAPPTQPEPAAPVAASPTPAPIPRPANDVRFCTECGVRAQPHHKFCTGCGHTIEEDPR